MYRDISICSYHGTSREIDSFSEFEFETIIVDHVTITQRDAEPYRVTTPRRNSHHLLLKVKKGIV